MEANYKIGCKTVLVGCLPIPFSVLPLCVPSWQRKDEENQSSLCHPVSNVVLCLLPVCFAWFYPIDQISEDEPRDYPDHDEGCLWHYCPCFFGCEDDPFD